MFFGYREPATLHSRAARSCAALVAAIGGVTGVASAQGVPERVLWRFEMDSVVSGDKVSVGPNGTIYASDNMQLYALDPAGGVVWTRPGLGAGTPIDFLSDGTLVTRHGVTVYALDPSDGSTVWQFSFDGNGFQEQIEIGPNVGPDGNIYVVSSVDGQGHGLGAYSLTPGGQLRWADAGSPPLNSINASTGGEVRFTQERMIFLFRFSAESSGLVYGYDLDGDQKLLVDFACTGAPRTDPLNRLLITSTCGIEAMEQDGGQSYWVVDLGAVNLTPEIGADATVYSAAWLGNVTAIRPNGTIQWVSGSAGDAELMLAVRQDVGRLVYSGGGFGVPNFVAGVDTADGALAWTVDMLTLNGHRELVWTSDAPTSLDGSTVYFSTRFTSNGERGALYAVRIDDFVCPPITSYCTTSRNSVGPGAAIGSGGSTSVTLNDLVLEVAGAVPSQNGIFYYGPGQVNLPFGDGLRCIGGGSLGLFRLPLVMLDGSGSASFPLDVTQPPHPSGQILPGSTWNFQFWYRDPAGPGGSAFNLSDALQTTWCP